MAAKKTSFLILDEPLNHLDEAGKKETERLLMELARNHGIPIISHRDMNLPASAKIKKIRMRKGILGPQADLS